MSYTHTLNLQDPSPLSINLKDQGLGVMLSLRMSIGSTTILSRGYSPYNLFAANEVGVWYDPSDLTTLFQDTAGTQPVTTAGQTVALALDKSKGLTLGPELRGTGTVGLIGTATAATYDTGTGAGSVTRVDLSNQSFVSIPSLVNGNSYRVQITVLTGTILLRAGSATSTPLATISAGSSNPLVVPATALVIASSSGTATFTLTSVRELAGNHATQATAASRPTYGVVPQGGRRNLLNDTDKPTSITGTAVTANAAVGPSGQMTAARVSKTDATTPRYVRQNSTTFTVTASTAYVAYRFVKYDGFDTTVSVEFNGGTDFGTSWIATFNVTASGVTLASNTACTGSVVDFGNGWYRIAAAFTSGTPTTPTNPSMLSRITGASGVSVLMTDAQLETGSTATNYQRVGSAFDVTEAGVPSLHYLSFDGVDDFLVTPTITPNIDKAQVFAGVRKLSDAAGATVVELSTTVAAVNGAMQLAAPSTSGAASYGFRSRGTVLALSDALSAVYAAPITSVLTGLGDISGDLATLRVNGTQAAQATADQGTGNYLAYPLYIGRRAGTSLPFNGQLYSLIVRFGANLDANTISNTETWVNSKTGAY